KTLALFDGEVIVTTGGEFVSAIMFTAADVVTLLLLSVAFAVSTCFPVGTLLHAKEYGAVASSPSFLSPAKNSTFLIEPSESDAFAVMVTEAPVKTLALFDGEVIDTVGGAFFSETIFTGADVVTLPWLSVALTVSTYFPSGTLLQTKEYGAVTSSPNFLSSAKNSTFFTEPFASVALAEIVKEEPAKIFELLDGDVIDVTGGELVPTVMFTTLDAVDRLVLSVALAVSVFLPAGGLFQTKV